MASLNKVFLLGNLTRVPELRYTPSGAAVCEFGLAVNRKYVSNNQEKDETCFVNIVVWGKQGESCQRYLEKGSAAMIEGRLQFDQWDDRDTGKKRSTLRVVAERVQFIGGRRDSGQESGGYQAPQQNTAGQAPQQNTAGQVPQQSGVSPTTTGAPAPVQGKEANGFPAMPNDAFQVNNDAEDDIPF
jgi:single-strand DNA-binding protein